MSSNEDPEYDLENVRNIETEYAEMLLEGRSREYVVDCKPELGAEELPPDRLNIAPQRNVRVYERADEKDEEFLMVLCLLRGGPESVGGLLMDRAIVFDGSVIDMLDSTIRAFDDGDWSGGIKSIMNIKARDDYEEAAEFLRELNQMLESVADSRRDDEAWMEYVNDPDRTNPLNG